MKLNLETEEIIQAIKENQSKILVKSLYEKSFSPILKMVRQKGGGRKDAEDCFQDALITLIKKVKDGSYDQKYQVHNFLFIIARNLWFNKIKRMQKVRAADVHEYEILDHTPNSETEILNEERKTAIYKLMDKAGEKCKELLRLTLFENKKLKEVMSLMDFSSEEVVKTTNYRCKKKLREELKNNPSLLLALKP